MATRVGEVRGEIGNSVTQELDEGRQLERFGAALPLKRRQRRLGELHIAARAPGQHVAGLRAREVIDGAGAHAAAHLDVGGAQLLHAAAMARAAEHPVADTEPVHDIEREQRDMRRPQHIAASVEHEIRQLVAGRRRCTPLTEPLQRGVVELQLRQGGNVTAEIAERLHALAPPFRQFLAGTSHGSTRHRQHETRIDVVVTGLDALTAEHAGRRPDARGIASFAITDDVENSRDHLD
jgi:hypothetical protein